MSSKKPPTLPGDELIVAAIDFGTTYSGYAYSFRDTPEKVYANVAWVNGTTLMMKTPTAILLNQAGQRDSFGYEAESKYSELVEEEEQEGWRFFRRFKMKLYGKDTIKRNLRIHDAQGKPMRAMTIFALSIEYMKDHLWKTLQRKRVGLEVSDIRWVLTVPAIWTDSAKQFMREASKQAGIESCRLTLVFEPEAAALFCKEQLIQKKEGHDGSHMSKFDPGQRFMVVDLGGGTADITVHEVQNDGKLKGLTKASGGAWGGADVDTAFIGLLKELFGEEVMEAFLKENTDGKLDIESRFELKKRNIKPDATVLSLPSGLFAKHESIKKTSFKNRMSESKIYSDKVQCKKDNKLSIDTAFLKEKVFRETIYCISGHIQDTLKTAGPRVKTILVVGGFSESTLVQKHLETVFPHMAVVIPQEAGVAVMKGAVLFGLNPNVICCRKSPYTIGISTSVPFDDKIHSKSHKVSDRCEDVFCCFVERDQDIVPGETSVERSFNAPKGSTSYANVEIYKSVDKKPMYTTDCTRIGTLNIDFNPSLNATIARPLVKVTMYFGDTELHVETEEESSQRRVKASFNFLL
ncbi:hypothetical protein ScPMuIL_016383 [Solemya velum]